MTLLYSQIDFTDIDISGIIMTMSSPDQEISPILLRELESAYDGLDYEHDLRRNDAVYKLDNLTPEDNERAGKLKAGYMVENFLSLQCNRFLKESDIVCITYGRSVEETPDSRSRMFRLQLVNPETGALYVLSDTSQQIGEEHWMGRIIHFGINRMAAGYIKTQGSPVANVVRTGSPVAIDISGTNFEYQYDTTLHLPPAFYQKIEVNGHRID